MAQKFELPYRFELYLPPGTGPFPLVCITPLLGRLVFLEDLYFERRFARYFASQGLAAAVIDRPIFDFDSSRGLEQIQDYVDASLVRNKKVLDELCRRPEIDTHRMATFGISFGSVINMIWAASDPRLRAHVFALGGGNLPELFIRSRDLLMRSYRKAALKKTSGDKSLLRERLKNIFRTDPLNLCDRIEAKNVLMILAVFDRVIPFGLGRELWKKMNRPRTVFLPLGHYTAVLAEPVLKRLALKFLKEKFR